MVELGGCQEESGDEVWDDQEECSGGEAPPLEGLAAMTV